jgi:hypothetical protein
MTIPYTTGTVSVTAGSAVVTGVGTAWVTGGIVGGELGLDRADGNPIPILSVDSNTQITLAKPWRGATAAAQPYWIIRDTAYLRQITDNAQKLATYIARLDNASLAAIAALAGTMVADKVPYATGPNSMAWATLTAFARSILDDANGPAMYGTLGEIPSAQLPNRLRTAGFFPDDFDTVTETGFYVGSTVVLNSPGPGARWFVIHQTYNVNFMTQICVQWATLPRLYYRLCSTGVWGPWQLFGVNILGSVSQSSGIPTGSLIERDSNANGEYVRLADGTQICTLASASLAYLNSTNLQYSWTFPAAFAAVPVIQISLPNAGSNFVGVTKAECGAVWQNVAGTASIACGIQPAGSSFVSGDQVNACKLMAIGRWF